MSGVDDIDDVESNVSIDDGTNDFKNNDVNAKSESFSVISGNNVLADRDDTDTGEDVRDNGVAQEDCSKGNVLGDSEAVLGDDS